jgi:hypothetical protein
MIGFVDTLMMKIIMSKRKRKRKKMNKKQKIALERSIELWTWLVENPDANKDGWPKYKRYRLVDKRGECFLCEAYYECYDCCLNVPALCCECCDGDGIAYEQCFDYYTDPKKTKKTKKTNRKKILNAMIKELKKEETK